MIRLSAVDAFFVAYQESAGILMSVGAEARLAGIVERPELERALATALPVWPVLGSRLERPLFGLRWRPAFAPAALVVEGITALDDWRNRPINPFAEPPFQVRWRVEAGTTHLAFKAHHAALDGQALFTAASTIVRLLAAERGGQPAPAIPPPAPMNERVGLGNLLSGARLRDLLAFTRWLKKEAQANRSARLALATVTPGPFGVTARELPLAPILQRAQALNVSPASLGAAAWMRAIAAFNAERIAGKGPISLEIPVSFRRRGDTVLGNLISPLTIFGDGTRALAELAVALHQRLGAALRRKLHHAVPLFAKPGARLPWRLFRRIAVTPTSTGFATSHFTLIEPLGDLAAEVADLSRNHLKLLEKDVWSPVCLAMGAAVLALPWGDALHLSITHRRNGIDDAAAGELIERLAAELA